MSSFPVSAAAGIDFVPNVTETRHSANFSPSAGKTGFPFGVEHWCRRQARRVWRALVILPPHRLSPIRGSSW